MAGWNLTLRFGLELAALFGFGAAAWTQVGGPMRWVAVVVAPLLAATAWGVFNVIDDPSRSGNAPVEVPGWSRLAIEFVILGGGVAAMAIAGRPTIALVLAVLIVVHYAVAWRRVQWLIAE